MYKITEYKCEHCGHFDHNHEHDDKGQCLVHNCECDGLL